MLYRAHTVSGFDGNLALLHGRLHQLLWWQGKISATALQIALAWVYKQAQTLGVTMVAIPGTKRVKYLEQNVAALDVQLSGEEHQQLCDAFAPDAVAGDRYAQKYLMYSKE